MPMSAIEQDGNVSIIDTSRDEVLRTLPEHGKLGEKIQAVVADKAEKTVFVVDAEGSMLVAVDIVSGVIKARIPTGKSPEGASLSPSGKQIAVCGEDDNVVTLVDIASLKAMRTIPTQGKNPEHCVFSRDEHWLLTSNENSNDVDIIDLKAGKSIALVPTSGHPRGIALLPSKSLAYIAQEVAGGVDVLDIATHKVEQIHCHRHAACRRDRQPRRQTRVRVEWRRCQRGRDRCRQWQDHSRAFRWANARGTWR